MKPAQYLQLIRHMGPDWALFRLRYGLKNRLKLLRKKTPLRHWSDFDGQVAELEQELEGDWRDHFRKIGDAMMPVRRAPVDAVRERLGDYQAAPADPEVIKEADRVLKGLFRFYSHELLDLGFPPRWHRNAIEKRESPKDLHWSEISDFGSGDIKHYWEPSRFAWVFPLARAYWRSGDEKYAEAFWTLFEDWLRENAPNEGCNWKCGQEACVRLMSFLFGLFAMLDAESTTEERLRKAVALVLATGERVTANLEYALSQSNNHGVGEAAGLATAGLVLPKSTRADRWVRRGTAALGDQLSELVYEDGSFSQHSTNYHRVMMLYLCWALSLAKAVGDDELAEVITPPLKRATRWLGVMMDPNTGRVPNLGCNDGALPLLLSESGFSDFRPTYGLACALMGQDVTLADGPWREAVDWLGLALAPDSAETAVVECAGRVPISMKSGGYYGICEDDWKVLTHCPRFRHRPAHADLLHVDLWYKGHNIALDSGTYSYNAPPPYDHAFMGTAFHNTVSVEGRDQMQRASRFLYLPWAEGKVVQEISKNGGCYIFEGTHDGYASLLSALRRVVIFAKDFGVVVIDGVFADASRTASLHWHLADLPHERDQREVHLLDGDSGDRLLNINQWVSSDDREAKSLFSFYRESENTNRGYWSPNYLRLAPCLETQLDMQGRRIVFVTAFTESPCTHEVEGERHALRSNGREITFTIRGSDESMLADFAFEKNPERVES